MSLIIQQHINASSAAAADQFKLNVKWNLQTLETNFQIAAASMLSASSTATCTS